MMLVRHPKLGEEIPQAVKAPLPESFRINPEYALVAEHEEHIVGLALLYGCGHSTVILDHFVVHADHAGGGVGVYLMCECLRFAREQGYDFIWGHTPNQNLVGRCKAIGLPVGKDPAYLIGCALNA